jgi:hypothetical protein
MAMSSPRVAAPDSFDAQIGPFYDSVFQDGFLHVLATRRCVPAVCWKKGRNQVLVQQYRKYGYLSQVGVEHGANQFGQLCTN